MEEWNDLDKPKIAKIYNIFVSGWKSGREVAQIYYKNPNSHTCPKAQKLIKEWTTNDYLESGFKPKKSKRGKSDYNYRAATHPRYRATLRPVIDYFHDKIKESRKKSKARFDRSILRRFQNDLKLYLSLDYIRNRIIQKYSDLEKNTTWLVETDLETSYYLIKPQVTYRTIVDETTIKRIGKLRRYQFKSISPFIFNLDPSLNKGEKQLINNEMNVLINEITAWKTLKLEDIQQTYFLWKRKWNDPSITFEDFVKLTFIIRLCTVYRQISDVLFTKKNLCLPIDLEYINQSIQREIKLKRISK